MADRVARFLLVGIIVWVPLPFASNRDWSSALLVLLIALLALLFCIGLLMSKRQPALSFRQFLVPTLLFGSAVAWAAVQALPGLPEGLLHPLWTSVLEVTGDGRSGYIALNPAESWMALLKLVSLGILFWVTAQLCRDRGVAAKLALTVVFSVALYAAYGLYIKLNGLQMILWYPKWGYLDDVTATFVNRNSFATFAGLGLVVTVALLVHEFRHLMQSQRSVRASILIIFDKLSPKVLALGLALVVISIALIMSNSRAGLASTLVALVALFLFLGRINNLSKKRIGALALVSLTGAVIVFLLFGESFIGRLIGIEGEALNRVEAYKVAVSAISDRPILGYGLGSFQDVFWMYRGDGLRGYWDKAHNTYLELALELGVPAAVMLVGSILSVLVICLKGLKRRRRDQVFPALSASALVLGGLHSTLDFSLQIPAVAAYYTVLAAIGFAQAWPSRDTAEREQ